jgi:hypothetical protein
MIGKTAIMARESLPEHPMQTPRFDLHQFAERHRLAQPASSATCLSFNDYDNAMHTDYRVLAPGRTKDAPFWAANETALRELLLCFLEGRAFLKRVTPTGTQKERLERACAKLNERVPQKVKVLRDRCRRYVEMRNSDAPDGERLRMAAIEIRNLDTEIRTTARLAEIVVGVVFFYHRCGLDSVETAERLHLSPCGVRQILWRLARTWERMKQN